MTDATVLEENPTGLAHNTLIVNDTEQRYGSDARSSVRRAAGYVYAVGDAADAYYTNPHYGQGDDKMLNVFQRELVTSCRSTRGVRPRRSAPVSNAVVKSLFHYPYNKPAITTDTITGTVGVARLFHKIILPATPALDWVDEASSGHDTWRLELRDATVRPNYLFMNVFQATGSTVTAMTPTERVTSEDGHMTGAVIKDAQQHHVIMFSADPLGTTPTGLIIC
jgi:hypothetical protein